MNVILGKINKNNLTKDILFDLRSEFDYQAKPNDKEGDYFGYHLCMDKKSTGLMKKGETPQEAMCLFISPEVFNLVVDENFNL